MLLTLPPSLFVSNANSLPLSLFCLLSLAFFHMSCWVFLCDLTFCSATSVSFILTLYSENNHILKYMSVPMFEQKMWCPSPIIHSGQHIYTYFWRGKLWRKSWGKVTWHHPFLFWVLWMAFASHLGWPHRPYWGAHQALQAFCFSFGQSWPSSDCHCQSAELCHCAVRVPDKTCCLSFMRSECCCVTLFLRLTFRRQEEDATFLLALVLRGERRGALAEWQCCPSFCATQEESAISPVLQHILLSLGCLPTKTLPLHTTDVLLPQLVNPGRVCGVHQNSNIYHFWSAELKTPAVQDVSSVNIPLLKSIKAHSFFFSQDTVCHTSQMTEGRRSCRSPLAHWQVDNSTADQLGSSRIRAWDCIWYVLHLVELRRQNVMFQHN